MGQDPGHQPARFQALREGLSDAPLSSGDLVTCCAVSLVGPHASDDAVGEVAFVGASGFAGCRAFRGLAVDVDAGDIEVALLGDAGDVQDAVDPPVAAEVEAMPDGQTVAFA
jgi:hypothetical protein